MTKTNRRLSFNNATNSRTPSPSSSPSPLAYASASFDSHNSNNSLSSNNFESTISSSGSRHISQRNKNTSSFNQSNQLNQSNPSNQFNSLNQELNLHTQNPIPPSQVQNQNQHQRQSVSNQKLLRKQHYRTYNRDLHHHNSHQEHIQHPPFPSSDASLPDFLYHTCLLRGEKYDVVIRVFGQEYKLHKLVLSRCWYFESLFSVNWEGREGFYNNGDTNNNSSNHKNTSNKIPTYTLHIDQDPHLTKEAFDLTLSHLYGHDDFNLYSTNALFLFAMSSFLNLTSLLDICVNSIVAQISEKNVVKVLNLFEGREYGEGGTKVVEAAKNFLCAEGYEKLGIAGEKSIGKKVEKEEDDEDGHEEGGWASLPVSVVAEVIASDAFYVPSEWERCLFLINLINWKFEQTKKDVKQGNEHCGRQNGNKRSGKQYIQKVDNRKSQILDDIAVLQMVLNRDIRYCHMTFQQLEYLQALNDSKIKEVGKGKPGQRKRIQHSLIHKETLREAVWMQTKLRSKVLGCRANEKELGLVEDNFIHEDVKDYDEYHDADTIGIEEVNEEQEKRVRKEWGEGVNEQKDDSEDYDKFSQSSSEKVYNYDTQPPSKSSDIDEHKNANSDLTSEDDDDGNSGDDEYGYDEEEEEEELFFPVPSTDETLDSHYDRYSQPSHPVTKVTRFPPFRFAVKFDKHELAMLGDSGENNGSYNNNNNGNGNNNENGENASDKAGVGNKVYSKTFWYAGTYWNVYIQKVAYRHKHQLGVYVHRASCAGVGSGKGNGSNGGDGELSDMLGKLRIGDPINGTENTVHNGNGTARPTMDISLLMANHGVYESESFFDALEASYVPANSSSNNSPNINSSSTTNPNNSHSNSNSSVNGISGNNYNKIDHLLEPEFPDYTDGRRKLSAFFEIYTPSRKTISSKKNDSSSQNGPTNSIISNSLHSASTYSNLTCFSSTPVNFSVSQSWGWKSARLYAKTEELKKGNGDRNNDSNEGLKFMISIGLV